MFLSRYFWVLFPETVLDCVTVYYIIKNYVRYELTFMLTFYSIPFSVNLMIRHETQAWCDVTLRGTSRQQEHVPEMKRSIDHSVYIGYIHILGFLLAIRVSVSLIQPMIYIYILYIYIYIVYIYSIYIIYIYIYI